MYENPIKSKQNNFAVRMESHATGDEASQTKHKMLMPMKNLTKPNPQRVQNMCVEHFQQHWNNHVESSAPQSK